MPVAGHQRRQIAREQRLDHRVVCQRRLGRRPSANPVHGEGGLKGNRIFGPQGAVIVEDGDSLGRGHMVGRGLVAHAGDVGEDGLLGGAVVPGGQGIGRGGRPESGREPAGGHEQGERTASKRVPPERVHAVSPAAWMRGNQDPPRTAAAVW